MSGCGLRNGEAAAVNLNNIVADDVYRVAEQAVLATRQYGALKHRKPGEYRDVLLPARVRAAGEVDIPDGMVLYGNRHFYAGQGTSVRGSRHSW